ncbi:MAG: hypothetical protein ACKE51_04185 [Methylococcaceae bacterium]
MSIDFGRPCIIFACLISSFFLIFSSAIFAETDKDIYKRALVRAHQEVAIAVAKLGDKIKECKKTTISGQKIKGKVQGIEENNLKLALAFLSSRNAERCDHTARADTLYSLSSLKLLKKAIKEKKIKISIEIDEYKKSLDHEFDILIGGRLPQMAYLYAQYEALPRDLRSKIESIEELQQASFDPFELFDKIIEQRNKAPKN